MKILLLLCLVGDSPYEVRDPRSKTNRADYLMIAPRDYIVALTPLGDHRSAQGYKVAIVSTESIQKEWKGVSEFIRFAVKEWTDPDPKFLLLVGDAEHIPPLKRRSAYQTSRFANDSNLATDHLFGVLDGGYEASIAVGRFPADTKEEVAVMVAKTLEYEKDLRPGAWQNKINFVTGQAGFNPFIDAFLERVFTNLVSDNIPPPYDIEVAYSKTSSKYCPYPPKFNENGLRLLNEGSLFYVYVGHGFRKGFDSLRWGRKRYPIFNLAHVPQVEVKGGFPIMFVIACSTGYFDAADGECVGEELFKRRRGPVAFVGGSRITQPYPNGLLGKALIAQIFLTKQPTLGWALVEAKKEILRPDPSSLRSMADRFAGAIQGRENLVPMRRDCVLHYNLLGDPALRIRKPVDSVKLTCPLIVTAGVRMPIRGISPVAEGKAYVALECPRSQITATLPKIDPSSPRFEEQITRRYRLANDKRQVFTETDVKGGEFRVELPIPDKLKTGDYFLKVTIIGPSGTAVGWAKIRCVD